MVSSAEFRIEVAKKLEYDLAILQFGDTNKLVRRSKMWVQ